MEENDEESIDTIESIKGEINEKQDTSADKDRLIAAIHYTCMQMSNNIVNDMKSRNLNLEFDHVVVGQVANIIFNAICRTWSDDLLAFAKHGKRSIVRVDDLKLLFRRNESLLFLIDDTCEHKISTRKQGSCSSRGAHSTRYGRSLSIRKEKEDKIKKSEYANTSNNVFSQANGNFVQDTSYPIVTTSIVFPQMSNTVTTLSNSGSLIDAKRETSEKDSTNVLEWSRKFEPLKQHASSISSEETIVLMDDGSRNLLDEKTLRSDYLPPSLSTVIIDEVKQKPVASRTVFPATSGERSSLARLKESKKLPLKRLISTNPELSSVLTKHTQKSQKVSVIPEKEKNEDRRKVGSLSNNVYTQSNFHSLSNEVSFNHSYLNSSESPNRKRNYFTSFHFESDEETDIGKSEKELRGENRSTTGGLVETNDKIMISMRLSDEKKDLTNCSSQPKDDSFHNDDDLDVTIFD